MMLKGIVGFEVTVSRLEGRWKLSQNRTLAEREAVRHGLEQMSSPESLVMQQFIDGTKP